MSDNQSSINISQLSDYIARNNSQLKQRLRDHANKLLTKLIHGMLDKADDTLFEFSSKADTDISQQIYLDAMREVRLQRNVIDQGFFAALNAAFDEFEKNSSMLKSQGKSDNFKADSLELVDDDLVEENMAIANMADKVVRRFHRETFEVKSRIFAVYHCENEEIEDHPLSPITIAKAFGKAFISLNINLQVKLIIFKLFDNIVMKNIGYVYKDINALLLSENILPDLAYSYKNNPSSYNNGSDIFNENDLDTETGNLLPTNFGLKGFTPIPTQANGIIGTLSAMQSFIYDEGYPEDMRPTEIGIGIIKGIQQLGFASVMGKQALDEKIINTVSMIFDFILDDAAIPPKIKNLLSRLQIPYLKVALIDETFLRSSDHSARQLLNDMAKASIGWKESSSQGNLLQTIETTVSEILNGYEQDNQLFFNLHKEFLVNWEKEKNTNRSYEERIWKTTEGKERVQYAKNRVDAWIHMWCTRAETRIQVATFLKHLWKNTMLYCMHKYGENSREWKYYIKIINALIWSTTPGKTCDEVKKIINITPLLVRGLNRGMLAVGTHPSTISKIFKEISKCHLEIIENGLSENINNSQLDKSNDLQTKKILNLYSKDPNMVSKTVEDIYQPTNEDQSDKPELEVDTILELLVEEVPAEVNEPENKTDTSIVKDEFYELATQLEYGDWVEFKQDGETTHGKLAWKSAITTNHLFVGRDGTRLSEKTLEEVAELLRTNAARRIDSAPVFERALSAVGESFNEAEVIH